MNLGLNVCKDVYNIIYIIYTHGNACMRPIHKQWTHSLVKPAPGFSGYSGVSSMIVQHKGKYIHHAGRLWSWEKRSWPIPIWWIVAISAICATRDSSILMGYSIINHPFRGIPILGNPHLFGQNLYIPRQNSLSLKPLAGSSPNAIRHLWSLCELGIRLKKDAPKWQLVISCN